MGKGSNLCTSEDKQFFEWLEVFSFLLLRDPDPVPGEQNQWGIHVIRIRIRDNCKTDSVSGMRGELLPGGVEEAQQVHLHAHVSHGNKVDALLLFSLI